MRKLKMGTPITRLIYSKIASPLSRSPTKVAINNQSHATFQKIKTSARYLNFESSAGNLQLTKTSSTRNCSTSKFQLTVTDYSQKLLINSPNKKQLMNYGVNRNDNLQILGKGTFGTVISGIYNDCSVAVKIVKLRKGCFSKLREKNALNLNHKNVVKILDVNYGPGVDYGIILMEHFNSCRHLQSVIDDRNVNLDLAKIVKYAFDICEGLLYCHSNKILHLDIKPCNILICEDKICKLCDFGNSQCVDNVSEENIYLGTVMYTAPELLIGKSPTIKCDVYSLGIVLWQMRHRELPYSNVDGVEAIIYKVVKFGSRPRAPTEEKPDKYFLIYSSCWSAEPTDRPEILDVINKLNDVI